MLNVTGAKRWHLDTWMKLGIHNLQTALQQLAPSIEIFSRVLPILEHPVAEKANIPTWEVSLFFASTYAHLVTEAVRRG